MNSGLRDRFIETRAALEAYRPRYFAEIAEDLGLPYSSVGMLSDVVNGRWNHVSERKLRDLRRRLGLRGPSRPDSYTLRLPASWRAVLPPEQARSILEAHVNGTDDPE